MMRFGLLVVLLSAVVCAGCNKVSPNAAPDFRFTMFDGKATSLHKEFGKPLVVNFWAVWCPPCRAEFPDFQEIYNAHRGEFRLVSVCVDNQQDPPGFVRNNGYTWEFATDVDGSKVYQVSGIPMTLFIDSRGELKDKHVGMLTKQQFETALAKILAPSGA